MAFHCTAELPSHNKLVQSLLGVSGFGLSAKRLIEKGDLEGAKKALDEQRKFILEWCDEENNK